MGHNPVLKKLGCCNTDRVVVINADDIALCSATLPAFFNLIDAGLVSSGSVMVPCAGFSEFADLYRHNLSADVGIHLTLTSEAKSYRWGPVSICDPASGLIDGDGYFHRDQSLWKDIDSEAFVMEMRAQVERARNAGIDLTHIDTHQFSALNPRLINHYVALGFEHQIPVLMVRHPHVVKLLSEKVINEWEEQGLPIFDHFAELPLNQPEKGRAGQAKKMFDNLLPGLTCILIHPAQDTPELRAMTDNWPQRVADYETFMSTDIGDYMRESGIKFIKWQALREVMQASLCPLAIAHKHSDL